MDKNIDSAKMYTVPEVSAMLRKCSVTIRAWIRKGKLKAVKTGTGTPESKDGHYLIKGRYITAYLKKITVIPDK